MEEFNYDRQLKAARKAARGLKRRLEGRILGQTLPAWGCSCGAISRGEAEAVEVVPAGSEKEYEGQITFWYLWNVKMRALDQTAGYSIGLSTFLPVDEIEAMFSEAFKSIDGDTLETECYARTK